MLLTTIVNTFDEDGSFDKTIIEAAACGAIPLVTSQSLVSILPDLCVTQSDTQSVAQSIQSLLDPTLQIDVRRSLERLSSLHSLTALTHTLIKEIRHV